MYGEKRDALKTRAEPGPGHLGSNKIRLVLRAGLYTLI